MIQQFLLNSLRLHRKEIVYYKKRGMLIESIVREHQRVLAILRSIK